MNRYIELIEPFGQNGNEPNSVMATSPNGDWVLYSEALTEIDALKAQNAELLAENKRLQFQANVVDALNDLAYCNGYDHGKKEMSAVYRKDADESIDRQRTNAHQVITKARGDL